MEKVKKKRRRLIDDGRVRVRLEFFAWPKLEAKTDEGTLETEAGLEIRPDKGVLALEVMLEERFGDEGRAVFNDWAERCALDTYTSAMRFARGARRAHAS